MALLKVKWSSTVEYEAEIEVDGWDEMTSEADAETDAMDSLLADQESDAAANSVGVTDRDVISVEVLRAGDEPVALGDVVAPAHAPEW